MQRNIVQSYSINLHQPGLSCSKVTQGNPGLRIDPLFCFIVLEAIVIVDFTKLLPIAFRSLFVIYELAAKLAKFVTYIANDVANFITNLRISCELDS